MLNKYHTFKDQLKHSLNSFEFKFLIKTFSYAALGFFSFALLLITVWSLDSWLSFTKNDFFVFFVFILSIASTFGFFYFFSKYRENPIETETSHINKTYALLFASYLFVFLFSFEILAQSLSLKDLSQRIFLTFYIFGITVCLYAIPALMGFFMQKHKTALTLAKFLKYCYCFYFVIFLIFLITAFTAGVIHSFFSFLLFIVLGIIIFSSPILTVYRMKNVVKYIDYTDSFSLQKWELFFTLEILVQLMQMAIYLVRFLLIAIGRIDRK